MRAVAEAVPPIVAALPPVVITEVQTGLAGSGNASKEFIELYNTTDQAIDISDWHLWYISGTASQTKHTIAFHRTNTDSNMETIIGAHQHYLLAGTNDASYGAYLKQTPDQYYTATLSDNGTLQLIAPDAETQCTLDIVDQVGWGTTAMAFEQQAAPSPPASQSLQRYIDTAGTYLDTNNNANDFWVTTSSLGPTPGAANAQNPQRSNAELQAEEPTVLAPFISLPEDNCMPTPPPDDGSGSLQPPADQPPATIEDTSTGTTTTLPNAGTAEPTLPAADIGLVAPQITEVLPNPAPPQTDTHDEFIELYNSNTTAFDLSGFTLEVGLTTKHHYAFPAGTLLQPKSFVAYFSNDTKLSLSNTAGQVWLLDPFGTTIAQTMQYDTAKDGQAWALANGSWYWTSKPTPNAANVIAAASTASATTSKKTTTASAKKTTASTSSSKTTKAAKAASDTATSAASDVAADNPLHPAVLAIIGGFALLYGAYEYRQDLAHKLYQLRANRTARREARRSLQGWRGD
jgi:hypothetical protein